MYRFFSNLNIEKEVSSVFDKVALLLEEVAIRVQVLHARGENVGVEPGQKMLNIIFRDSQAQLVAHRAQN